MNASESRSYWAKKYLEAMAEVKRLRAERLGRVGEWLLIIGDSEHYLGKTTYGEALAKAKQLVEMQRQLAVMIPHLCRVEARITQQRICQVEEVGA